MSRTRDMLLAENSAGERLRSILDDLECRLSCYERVALAFTIIERLKEPNNIGVK